MCFYTTLHNFANMASSDQLTSTARTASKFCAQTRSKCLRPLPGILQNPGSIEPWSKRQPEGSGCEVATSLNEFHPWAGFDIVKCLCLTRKICCVGSHNCASDFCGFEAPGFGIVGLVLTSLRALRSHLRISVRCVLRLTDLEEYNSF